MKSQSNLIETKIMDLISRLIKMVEHLPKDSTAEIMGKAVITSSTSAGIYYSDAQKAKSGREFLHNLHLMQVQLNQTDFWLKLIEGSHYFRIEKIASLKSSNNELMKIVAKSLRTANENQKKLAESRKVAREKAVKDKKV